MINCWDNGLYARGFIIAKNGIDITSSPSEWKRAFIGDGFQICYDPRNQIGFFRNANVWVFMCGSYCMDVERGIMDIDEIVSQLAIKLISSEKDFFRYLAVLNGRFVVLYSNGHEIKILGDATASRSVYYSTQQVVVASHYNLIQNIVKQSMSKAYEMYVKINEERVKNSRPKVWVLPGDYTPYDNIKILLPNHYVELNNLTKAERFFPMADMQEVNVDSVCGHIATTISYEAEVLSQHYNILQSLTSGIDSRISLAATKNIKNDINFFCYKNKRASNDYSTLDRMRNFDFAKRVCEKEQLKFIGVTISDDKLPEFAYEILKQNHYHQSIPQLLINYSGLFQPQDIHLRSNLIEICRDAHTDIHAITRQQDAGKIFAKLMGYKECDVGFSFIAALYQEYYDNDYAGKIYNYSATHLFYWEHKCGQWVGGAILTENDITNDTFQLFNCRNVLDLSLCLPLYYKNRNIVYDKVIGILWPELLNYGLPNKEEPLYNLIDPNRLSQAPILGNILCIQGNLGSPEKTIDAVFEMRLYGVSFGFGGNAIHRNDFCGIVRHFDVVKDTSYQFSFTIKSFWQQAADDGAVYEIIIDNQCVYSLPTKSYYDVNQVDCCFKASTNKTIEVIVRLRAPKDYFGISYNGIIDVLCVNLKRDFANEYDYVPMITDSFYQKKANMPIARFEAGELLYGNKNCESNIRLLEVPFKNQKSVGNIAKKRDEIFGYEKELLNQPTSTLDIDNLKGIKNGKYKFVYKGIHFDCLLTIKQNAPLYVILNGSKTNPPPIFKRWSWYNTFNGTTLNISDSSYAENEALYLGWYFGTKELNYRQLVAEIVLKFANYFEVDKNDIYFYGSSGGGAAAIHCAGLIEGSTAMVINPQIFLNQYHYAKMFKSITGIDLAVADKWHREDLSYFILNSPKSRFLIVSNMESPDDAVQILSLSKRMGEDFFYGINRFGNIGIWLYDVYTKNTPLHNAQEDQTLYYAIDNLAKTLKTSKDWDDLKETYWVISELWRQKAMLLDKMKDSN